MKSPRARRLIRRIAVTAAASGLAASLLVVPSVSAAGQASGSTSGGVTFGPPIPVNPVEAYGEPDIKIDSQGRTYVSGPWGTGTQRSIFDASTDGGSTFLPLHDHPIVSPNDSVTQITGPGGGDTEISIDHTGKVYYSDLAALVTLKTVTWVPQTKTMAIGSLASDPNQGLNGFDRQWFALWDPPDPAAARAATGYTGPFPVNYLTAAQAVLGSGQGDYYSFDGINYVGPSQFFPVDSDGPTVIDQLTGTVIEAIGMPGTNAGTVGVALAKRGGANAATDPSLSASTEVKIADLPAGTNVGALFPSIALDAARNAYVVWVTRSNKTTARHPNAWQIFYSYARARSGWTKWSTPRRLSTGPAGTNVMPWVTAGAAGQIAAVWYGTDDTRHNPSTQDSHQAWYPYVSVIRKADTATPNIAQLRAMDTPSHYGTICLEGLGCILVQGNRNNADFFEVTTDPRDGAVVLVFDDTSNELIQPGLEPVDGTFDHRGAPVVTIERQATGNGLFGTPVTPPRTSGHLIPDRAGDALFDPVYGTPSSDVPQLDMVGASVRTAGDNLIFRFHVKDLTNLTNAFTQTRAGALEYVIRWKGKATDVGSTTGVKNPIYFVALEVDPPGTPGDAPTTRFFAGTAESTELCSVSACTPHIVEYLAPPNSSTLVTGQLMLDDPNFDHDHFEVTVPRSLVGDPQSGDVLEGFGGYSFIRNKTASTRYTNGEQQAGIAPILIDGVCCLNVKL